MTTAAVIVGIDDYRLEPLTSAVRDAVAFRDVLIELKLAPAANIRLLTSQQATSRGILRALQEFYKNGDSVDQFFFFFAGHGILAYSNTAHTRTRTALVPVDVEDLEADGKLLIDFDELYQTLAQTGPQEQLFFLDACRDVPYEKQPNVTELGWSGVQPGLARRQAVLYAVSPLGQAKGSKGGMGQFTGHLIEGLGGKGLALDFDPAINRYVITMESLHSHVYDRVNESLRNEPLWTRYVQAPQLKIAKPGPAPLRVLKKVESRPLTVHIEPDAAADQTEVKVSVRGYPLDEHYCYPLNKNHDTIQLQPQHYVVEAVSTAGSPDPMEAVIDLRRTSDHTIRVLGPALPEIAPRVPPPHLDVPPPLVERSVMHGLASTGSGLIEATALEPQVAVSIRGLEAPFSEWSGAGSLRIQAPAGPYRAEFRLGADVFSRSDIYVTPGSQLSVSARAAMTPLLTEAMATPEVPRDATLSESIGPMQSGLLATVLPMLGIKVFDINRELFSQFRDLVEPRDAAEFGDRPLSIVIAADGDQWGRPLEEVLEGTRCEIAAPGADPQRVILGRLSRGTFSDVAGDQPDRGLHRIRLGCGQAPGAEFSVRIFVPYAGTLVVSSAAIRLRATVLALVLKPDGSMELNQNLLRIPGRPYPDDQSPEPRYGKMTYGRLLRLLQIGQKLYRSGELFQRAMREWIDDDIFAGLESLLFGKWVDPLLGCMGYLAGRRAKAEGLPRGGDLYLDVAAENLWRYFGELPDTRVIYGLEHPEARTERFDALLQSGSIPLLLESAQALADYAIERGNSEAAVVDVVRRAAPGQPWSQVLLPGPEQARAAETKRVQANVARAKA